MTSEEKQEIINAVLAALRTNSKSIDQLTPVSEMLDADFLELNGGRKVSYGVLFANHMSNDDAQEAWEYLDTHKVDKDSRGLVEVHQAPVVFLDAMGTLDGHSLNGSEGLEYRTDTKLIYDFPGGLLGAPKQGAVYISKNNFKKFVWNGTELVELKVDECPLFVDYMEPVAFATLPVGGSYYVPSSHKIAVKIDASNTKTYDPLPDALYFFRDKGKVYTWNSSTNKWVPVSSDINVVNNLTDGGEEDALSAEQGKVLKGLIDNIGTGSIAAFTDYAVAESVSALPATGVATTGYIVGTHIYAYVGTGGDTKDGKYQDLGALEAAGVSLTTNGDGTFTVHAGGNDYTVNLNHTHENMAKLIVCEESDLPSTLDEDTIYGVEDSGEIAMLYVGGLPFYGGGGGVSTPVLRKPIDGSTIDVGRIASGDSSVEHTIEIKGRNLTQALAVAVTGTGFSIKNGVSSISAADANVGTTITIVCTSSSEDAAGELSIASSEVSCDCDLISNKSTYEDLSGVKMNGAQWLLTDYYPNPNTELLLKVHFERNSNSLSPSANDLCGILLSCELGESNKRFMIYTSRNASSNNQYGNHNLWLYNSNGVKYGSGSNDYQIIDFNNSTDAAKFIADGLQIQYTKGSSNGVLRALDAGDNVLKSVNTTLHGVTQENPLRIGIGRVNDTQTETLYAMFDVTIKSFTITENGTTVRNWVPKLKNGTVAGLYDTVNDTFISSQTATGLVAVQ